MPANVYLTRKGTTERYGPHSPNPLALIDDELRTTLGEPADSEHWLYGWACEGSVAYALAMNKDWTWIRENFSPKDAPIFKVIDYLESTFDVTNDWGSESVWNTRKRKP